ncbi:hypothetical protein GCM10009827_030040 [Dactylosporangium maewongense]|uniref:Uncharacterized protein n=2 Tax=Dactylosporangium maewongense TaxID=634393 RepID=A0ABN2A856_9ACTN
MLFARGTPLLWTVIDEAALRGEGDRSRPAPAAGSGRQPVTSHSWGGPAPPQVHAKVGTSDARSVQGRAG